MKTEPEVAPDGNVLERFTAQSHQQFAGILRAVESQVRQADELRAELVRLADGIYAVAKHSYNVFGNSATGRLVVLRDVEKLRGEPPLYSAGSFSEALAWVNANPPAAPLPDESLRPPLGPGPLGPLWPPPSSPHPVPPAPSGGPVPVPAPTP